MKIRQYPKAMGQAINWKLQKICQNSFYKWFRVVLGKKPLEKNTKYSINETILKIGNHAKPIAFANSSPWVKQWSKKKKIKKNVKIHSRYHLELFWVKKKNAEKNKTKNKKQLNIREMRPLWKSAINQGFYLATLTLILMYKKWKIKSTPHKSERPLKGHEP